MVNMGEMFAHGRIGDIPMDRVPLNEKEAENFLLEPGDLLFARQSLVLEGAGKCSLFLGSKEPVTFESHIIRARLDRKLGNPNFFYYFFQSPPGRNAVRSIVEQVAAAGIRSRDLAKLQIPDIPLSTQDGVAAVLGAMDDKIELNHRMSETLESIARALFKSWFVDFDLVRAKVEGDQPAMPDSIAALFPNVLQPSAIGDIPAGWHVGKIDDVAEINSLTLSRTDPLQVIDYVEISEVMGGEIGNIIRYERGAEPSRARRRLRHGDTVLSTVRPDRGAHFLALNPPETLIVSTGFVVLTPMNGRWAFVYSLTTRPTIGRQLGRLADGGAYPAIRPETVSNLPVALPPTEQLIERFEQIARPLYEKCSKNREQSKTLAALRDVLLPQLISGELRVPNIEHVIGGCT